MAELHRRSWNKIIGPFARDLVRIKNTSKYMDPTVFENPWKKKNPENQHLPKTYMKYRPGNELISLGKGASLSSKVPFTVGDMFVLSGFLKKTYFPPVFGKPTNKKLDNLQLPKNHRGIRGTLPETNSNFAPENRNPKGNQYSNHPFSGAMLVSGRLVVYTFRSISSRSRCLEDEAGGGDFTHHAFGFRLHWCRSCCQNQTQKERLGKKR